MRCSSWEIRLLLSTKKLLLVLILIGWNPSRKIYLLHAATGHGHVRHLIQALKRRGAPRDVIQEAERFKCAVRAERSITT